MKIVRKKKTIYNVCCVPLNHRHSKFDHFGFIIHFYPEIGDTMCFSLLEGVSHCFQLRLYSCLFFVTSRCNFLLMSSITTSIYRFLNIPFFLSSTVIVIVIARAFCLLISSISQIVMRRRLLQ